MTAAAGAARRRRTFVDPSSPVFWSMTLLIVVGAIILGVQDGPGVLENPGRALAAAAAWAIYGLVGVGIVIALQRYGRRPAVTVIAALAYGGLAATAFSSIANGAVAELLGKLVGSESAGAITSGVTTPLIEESLKIAGIVGLALIPAVRVRGALDGLFWGVLVGAGFQVVEHFVYTVSFLQSATDTAAGIAQMLFVRGLLTGLFTHSVFGGIEGAAVGYAVSRRGRSAAWRALVVTVAIALVLVIHGLFDWVIETQEASPVLFVIDAIPVVVLIGLVVWARRDAARRLAGIASIAVEQGVMTDVEAEALRSGDRAHGRAAKRRRLDHLRYLDAVEDGGAGDPRAAKVAAKLRD